MKMWWCRLKPALPALLATAGWVLFFALAMACSRNVQRLYPGVSLRYAQPIPHDTAVAARQFSAAGEDEPWPTYWTEGSAKLAGNVGQASCTAIWFSGEGSRVWPTAFLSGGYPAVLEENGIAVSTGTAWALWGSYDVLGFEAAMDGETCLVRGVFENDRPMLLAGVGDATFEPGWMAVELEGLPAGGTKRLAEDYALQSGLRAPAAVVDGPAIAALCRVAALLSATVLMVVYCIRFLRWVFARWPKHRPGIIAGLALAAALLLPLLLDSLSPALVPNRWSDFTFWRRLGQQVADDFTGFLKMQSFELDLSVKLNLLAVMFCSLIALFFSVALVVQRRRKMGCSAGGRCRRARRPGNACRPAGGRPGQPAG